VNVLEAYKKMVLRTQARPAALRLKVQAQGAGLSPLIWGLVAALISKSENRAGTTIS